MRSIKQLISPKQESEEPSTLKFPEPANEDAEYRDYRKFYRGVNFLFGLCLVAYAIAFWVRVQDYWFNPGWTTDDSLQQLFPFHKVYHPELFKGDLITKMVEGYLTPIHYAISYGVTYLTRDPVMMGHWVMLLQLVSCAAFMFLAVRYAAGLAPALFSLVWLLHTRHVMQRLTAGLPRGWSAAVFTAYFYFAVKRNHKAILLTILVGCLLHPPGTLIIAGSYGLLLLWRVAHKETRAEYLRPLLVYMALSPLYVAVTLYVLHRPPEIGQMASYEQALKMPEFLKPLGRFPFVPLKEPWDEIKSFGFQAFLTRFYNPGKPLKSATPWIVMAALAGLALVGKVRKRTVLPAEVNTFLVAAIGVYFASRIFAFKLYVPDRHLQFPLAIYFIAAFSIGVWRACARTSTPSASVKEEKPMCLDSSRLRYGWSAVACMVLLGSFVALASGHGLKGAMNFNFSENKKGGMWHWLRHSTPENVLIAGHPTHIDGVYLFGMRQGYVTTETAHPFYDIYLKEMNRRIDISLRAHYARTLPELVSILEPEKIDYFIFSRRDFYPESLPLMSYFPPHDALTRQLVSRPLEEYAYRQLPGKVDLQRYPFMPYKDEWSAIVDIKKLRAYLITTGQMTTGVEPQAEPRAMPDGQKQARVAAGMQKRSL